MRIKASDSLINAVKYSKGPRNGKRRGRRGGAEAAVEAIGVLSKLQA